MSTADYVAFRLHKMRQDARERVAREINRQLSLSSSNGGFGGFQMYAGLERAAAEVYAAVLDDVARFLLNAKSDAVTLERLTMDLAGDIVDELEWRRGKIDGPLFDGLVRRVRAVMEKARKDVIEEFVLGLVGGRRWPP
jgi:hypothetical protein